MSDRCYHGVTPAEECMECIEPESSLGYAQGRADERAAIAKARGEHEVKKPDQCMDCGSIIIGAHGCQGRPGDEES